MQLFFGGTAVRTHFCCKGIQPSCAQQLANDPKCLLLETQEGMKRVYEQWVWEVEHSTFAPVIFSATGGMRLTAAVVFKRLAGMIADRSNQQYCTKLGTIRCQFSFSLLQSAIMCLKGSWSSFYHPIGPSKLPADVVISSFRVTDTFAHLMSLCCSAFIYAFNIISC